ncbi:unnamed protein product [Linum trigynum]|uniref:Uncharacterized protein n=1 Tax=Linum trigynum TaxID=586398 RepID=A0AAV2EJM5_9ROSI
MAPINPLLNAHLAPAAIFTNRGFRNSEAYSRYLRCFSDRALHPSFLIPPTSFNRYRLRVNGYINDLGWSSLFQNRLLDQCPEAVRMFYSSMQCGPGRYPSYFTTTVYNFSVTRLRESPLSRFSVERLPDDLRALQFYISHVFLPRTADQAATLDESDLWILFNAKTSCPISYASLMFNHMIKYQEEECSGKLPFGLQITHLLALLGVDLRGKIINREVHSDLQAQHVLRRPLSWLGPRKLAKVQGGDKAANCESKSEPEEDDNDEVSWLKDTTAAYTAAGISRLDKGKGIAESSGKRKTTVTLEHIQEGVRLENEGKSLLRDLTLSLKGKEASSSGKKVSRVLFLPSEDEEVDPSEYASSPEYTY